MIRPALHLLLAVTLGLALIYVLRPRPLLAMLTAAAVPFVLIFIGRWFVTQYKYVRLSAAGICGRPVAGFKPQAVSWEEPLSVTATSLPGLKGHTFTSSTSGASIFVPYLFCGPSCSRQQWRNMLRQVMFCVPPSSNPLLRRLRPRLTPTLGVQITSRIAHLGSDHPMLYAILTSVAVLLVMVAVVAFLVGISWLVRLFRMQASQLLSTKVAVVGPPVLKNRRKS